MTKPFQSIRQLFGRVLGSNPAPEDTTARDYSMLGIDGPEAQPSTNGHGQSNAYALENSEPDIEVQTADTQRLPQIAPEFLGGRNGGASHSQIAPEEIADEFGDSVLDLGDFSGGKAFAGDDPFLDVLDEAAPHEDFFVEAVPEAPALAEYSSDAAASVPAFEEREHWAVATETVEVEESAPASSASPANLSDLSAEAIDAIARRVVERLSDKVVREIAWEVVPELSELLIKQKLEKK
jgi:hypothetical protein